MESPLRRSKSAFPRPLPEEKPLPPGCLPPFDHDVLPSFRQNDELLQRLASIELKLDTLSSKVAAGGSQRKPKDPHLPKRGPHDNLSTSEELSSYTDHRTSMDRPAGHRSSPTSMDGCTDGRRASMDSSATMVLDDSTNGRHNVERFARPTERETTPEPEASRPAMKRTMSLTQRVLQHLGADESTLVEPMSPGGSPGGSPTKRNTLKWNQHEEKRMSTWEKCCKGLAKYASLEFVRGNGFQFLCSGVIVLNAGFTGYSASLNLAVHAYGRDEAEWLFYVDVGFCIFFFLELLLRLSAECSEFFIGEEWRWNMVDVLLVGTSVADLLMNSLKSGPVSAMKVGRILRLSRFLRLIRIARVMKELKALRLVVFAILNSMASLFWSFVLIGCIMYTVAVVILHGASDHFQQVGFEADDLTSEYIRTLYGGIYTAMVTLFMAISGGADWGELMWPLTQISKLYGPFFIAYIFFLYFGVINVVVGACVATTADIAAKDREACAENEVAKIELYTKKVQQFFKEADEDNSGTLTWDEFERHMDNKKVKGYFQSLDIDVSQANILFDLLDSDQSDCVTIDEFLDGCTRLRGGASKTEMNMLLFLTHKLSDQMHDLEKHLSDGVPALGKQVPPSNHMESILEHELV